jgi:hypothetical protein
VALVDIWDPNTWSQDQFEHRIYADDYANEYAVVDQVDYQYLVQWRWKLKKSKVSKGTIFPKVYLARSAQIGVGRLNRIVPTLFLHTAIMERTGIPKPKTNKTIIVDHKDGDERNCRRKNLHWASISFNNTNIYGSHEHQLLEA